jgi:hypothetical protein
MGGAAEHQMIQVNNDDNFEELQHTPSLTTCYRLLYMHVDKYYHRPTTSTRHAHQA